MSDQVVRRVALIGYGYWGKKLARVLQKSGALEAVVDSDPDRQKQVLLDYPGLSTLYTSEVITSYYAGVRAGIPSAADGVVIATPPETHFALARKALEEGLHTFVEKPLATSSQEAKILEGLAREKKLMLATGHTHLYAQGLRRMPRPAGKADLAVRMLNPGGAPSGQVRDMRWAWLPHAVSIALSIFQAPVVEIETCSPHEDRLFVTLAFRNDSVAHIDVGDNTGIKVRQVELQWGNTRYCYDGDRPGDLNVVSGTLQHGVYAPLCMEPLQAEISAFLQGTPILYPSGSQVVQVIEEIAKCSAE